MCKKRFGVAGDFYWIKLRVLDIDVKSDTHLQEITVDFPVLLPHEMLAAIYHCGPARFKKSVLGPMGENNACSKFWDVVRNAPWLQTHPIWTHSAESRAYAAPWYMFGDHGSIFENKEKLLVVLTGSALSDAETWDSRFLYAALPNSWIGPNTMHDLELPLAWSFKVGSTGHWPKEDHLGNRWKEVGLNQQRHIHAKHNHMLSCARC